MVNRNIFAYGGSVVCPSLDENQNPEYSEEAVKYLVGLFEKHSQDDFLVVVGGGALAKKYIANREREVLDFFNFVEK